MSTTALDRWITGNYGEDQFDEDCLACEDEGTRHTCGLAEIDDYLGEEEDFEDDEVFEDEEE